MIKTIDFIKENNYVLEDFDWVKDGLFKGQFTCDIEGNYVSITLTDKDVVAIFGQENLGQQYLQIQAKIRNKIKQKKIKK